MQHKNATEPGYAKNQYHTQQREVYSHHNKLIHKLMHKFTFVNKTIREHYVYYTKILGLLAAKMQTNDGE